jgi:hypothetical protein
MNGLDESLPFSFFSLYFILPTALLEGNGNNKEVFGAILLLRRAKRRTWLQKPLQNIPSFGYVAVFFFANYTSTNADI